MTTSIPPTLAAIAAGRSHINTAEAGCALNRNSHTIRKLYSEQGHAYGIRPTKLPGSSRLMWPVDAIAQVIGATK